MELIKGKRFDQQKIQNSILEELKYDDCTFFKCNFDEVIWDKCHFHNTAILGYSVLKKCKFIDCKFTGQHTYMGGPTKYMDCEFENITFKNIQFWNTNFINCIFSGHANNIVFYGSDAPEGWETKFNNVNIKQLHLEFVEFRCNFDLSKTIK